MAQKANQYPIEIEGKYRVEAPIELLAQLDLLGAQEQASQTHEDHYLKHPSRDFKITDEALRIRRVDDHWLVTYKGPRQEGVLKTRPEIELPLAQGTQVQWMSIWENLGFEPVAIVRKTRRIFDFGNYHPGMIVVLDQVPEIGTFAEIECVVHSDQELSAARLAIESAAKALGLNFHERRSYLSMVLEQQK
jgi:adenylate cyclase class 2